MVPQRIPIKYSEFCPNPYWQGVLRGVNYLFNRGGRGTGKTKGSFKEAIYLICLKRNHSLLIVRRHESTHRTSTFNECVEILEEHAIPYGKTKNPLHIRLFNGSEIVFKGLDKPEKIKSIATLKPLGGVIFEESTEFKNWDGIDTVIQSVRSVSDPKFIFNYNPDNPNHWLRDFETELEDKFNGKAKLTVSTIYDNPFLEPDFIQRQEARKEYDEKQYNVSVLGRWENLGQVVYTINWEKNKAPAKIENEREFFHTISIGIDLGDVEATTFVAVGYKNNYQLAIPIKEYSYANKDNPNELKGWDDYVNDLSIFIEQIKQEYDTKIMMIYCEYATAGNAFIIMARRIGINIMKAPKEFPIKERVMFVEWMLLKGILQFRKDTTPLLLEQFRNASRDLEAKGNDYFRVDKNDIHLLDSFDYQVIKLIKYIGGREWQQR